MKKLNKRLHAESVDQLGGDQGLSELGLCAFNTSKRSKQ